MSTVMIKIIALVAMTFDHLFVYLPLNFPIAFRWIGRIAAPLFIYTFVIGMQHTSNRKKHLFNLYIFSVLTGIVNIVLVLIFRRNDAILSNVFPVLFVIGAYIYLIEKGYSSKKQKVKILVFFTVIQAIIGALILFVSMELFGNNISVMASIITSSTGILPNFLSCESSYNWVLLGLFMYYCRDDKKKLTIIVAAFSFYSLLSTALIGFTFENIFYVNFEWMMISCIPFILMYNGKRGRKLKKIFYIYYPLHIWFLYTVAAIKL